MNKQYYKDLEKSYKYLRMQLQRGMMEEGDYEALEDQGDIGFLIKEVEEERSNLINAIDNYLEYFQNS